MKLNSLRDRTALQAYWTKQTLAFLRGFDPSLTEADVTSKVSDRIDTGENLMGGPFEIETDQFWPDYGYLP